MQKALVIVIAGSLSDAAHYEKIITALREFNLDVVLHVGSAHKTPEHVLQWLSKYETDPRPKVYITIAGRSNALSGFVDGAVTAPVIACPPPSEAFAGLDILSSLRMPSGIAPGVVLDPQNAALFAAKMLGLVDAAVREKVKEFQHQQIEKIINT